MSTPLQSINDVSTGGTAVRRLRTEEEAKAVFRESGTSIADWAREHGFSGELTRMVLAGKRKCLRGQSHQIAVALCIKSSTTNQG